MTVCSDSGSSRISRRVSYLISSLLSMKEAAFHQRTFLSLQLSPPPAPSASVAGLIPQFEAAESAGQHCLRGRQIACLEPCPRFAFLTQVSSQELNYGPRQRQVLCSISALGQQLCLSDGKTVSFSSQMCPVGWPDSSAAVGNLGFN